MSLNVAASLTHPGVNAACLAACGQDGAPVGDFAALLLSLSAPGEDPQAIPPEIVALLDSPDAATAATATADGAPANPLQNLLAGLLALQGQGAAASVPQPEMPETGLPTPATKTKGTPASVIGVAAATGKSASEPEAPALRAGENAATGILPAAAKLAEHGNQAAATELDLPATTSESSKSSPQLIASLASASGNRPGNAAAPLPVSTAVATPFGNPAWAADFSQRVVMLARGDAQSAQITLNPAHLGPIEVRLSLSGGEATAVFVSPHGDVREALESALPRLREMFAGAGISLGQTQVNAQSQGSGGQQQGAAGNASLADRTEFAGTLADNESGGRVVPLARGLVDTFA